MKRSLKTAVGLVGAASLILLAGCTTDPTVTAPDDTSEETTDETASSE